MLYLCAHFRWPDFFELPSAFQICGFQKPPSWTAARSKSTLHFFSNPSTSQPLRTVFDYLESLDPRAVDKWRCIPLY